MSSHDREGGFALPLALLVLLISAGAALTTLNATSSERRVRDSEHAGNQALMLAQSALAQSTAPLGAWNWAALPTATSDSARITFTGGYADLIRTRIRPMSTGVSAIYLIRARGVYTKGGWAGAPSAMRVVTRYGTYSSGTMDVRAAWTPTTGLHKNGGSGTIDGNDACGAASAVGGVAVPDTPGYDQNGGGSVPEGNPDIASLGATAAAAAASLNINWSGITNGSAITPDITIPGGSWPSFSDPNYWPVIYIDNAGSSYSLPGDGRGTLIVRGDFTISGSKQWNGPILVGGTMTSNGNNTVEGAVITGLNLKLGEAVGVSDVGNGTKTFVYNSCNIANAMTAFGGLKLLTNTWFDGWALY
jgi:hypothetical protein